MDFSKGYQCDFINQVPEDLFCKSCSRVARQLTVTECCGESYCCTCIKDTQQEGKPCPKCWTENFNIYKQPKYQKKIESLQVYCTWKDRGCYWSGTLEQLDCHLDPDQDSCQYVDTKCPLNCQLTIPKSKVEQHVAQECTKRPHVCQHCGFKATYEEVVDIHLPECKYVPLQCPNRCGVTCEREDMEDHMKMCRLEEIVCKFHNVGCNERFNREEEDVHTEKNTQHHLVLTSTVATRTKEELQQKIENLELKLRDQERRIKEQETIHRLEKQGLEEKLARQEGKFMKLFKELFKCSDKPRSFEMSNFRSVMNNHYFWKSPVMYTHIGGYKLFIGIISSAHKFKYDNPRNAKYYLKCDPSYPSSAYAFGYSAASYVTSLFGSSTASTGTTSTGTTSNGTTSTSTTASTTTSSTGTTTTSTNTTTNAGPTSSNATSTTPRVPEYLFASVHVIQGEHDDELKWPVRITCMIEIVNQRSGNNKKCTLESKWNKPDMQYEDVIVVSNAKRLVETTLLKEFSYYDSLYFRIASLQVM